MIPNSNVEGAALLYILDLIATILSFLGSLLMLYFCYKVPSPRASSLKFILAVSIADLFYSIANILSNFETSDGTLCYVEGVIRESSFILTIFFSTCVAVASHKVSWQKGSFSRSGFFILSAIVAPILCIFMSILAPIMFKDHLEYAYGPLNCGISLYNMQDERKVFMFYMAYNGIPIMIGLTIILIGYLRIIYKIRKLPVTIRESFDLNIFSLLIYPLVLVITFLPSIIDHIVGIFYPVRPVWITALRMAITHSIGFINAVMYIRLRNLNQQNNKKKSFAEVSPDFDMDSSDPSSLSFL